MHRSRAPCILLALPLALVSALAPTAEAGVRRRAPRAYERWVQPPNATAAERRALRTLRRWSNHEGQLVQVDARLQRAARRMLPDVPDTPGQRIDLDRARNLAQRHGWTDGQLAAVTLRLPSTGRMGRELRRHVDEELGGMRFNRVGIAARAQGKTTTVVVLLSHRLVDLMPLPSRVRGGGSLRLSGAVRPSLEREAPARLSLAIARPNGTVDKTPVRLRDDVFDYRLAVGDAQGVLGVQLLLDRGQGPVVAALFPVGVDAPPFRNGPEPMPEPMPMVEEDTEAALASLILGLRSSRELPLPAQSARLQDAARSHARDMRSNDYFAHVSPTTGAVTDRLARRGVVYVRALENIAVTDGIQAALQQWLDSPSHRANLLDPQVDSLGIGVEVEVGPTGSKIWAVAVLARLADDAAVSELAGRAHDHLNRERKRLGLPPLKNDRRLVRLAERHSREIAGIGKVLDTSPVRGHLVDVVFSEVDVREAAADVYLASSVDVVGRSAHLRERFSRAGIGIHRDGPGGDGRLWVTVIYAAD